MPQGKLLAASRTFGGGHSVCRRGRLAAILHGAPVQTLDIDLVYSRDPENIQRLLDFLAKPTHLPIQPHRRLRPNESHLAGGGHLNLLTRYGPVDLLGMIGNHLGYADLLPHSNEMDIGEGLRIQVSTWRPLLP